MVSPLFNVGDLTLIDEKDKAYILEVDIQAIVDGSILYKICYQVGNYVQNNIEEKRCKATTLFDSATTRSGTNRHFPSLNFIQRRQSSNNSINVMSTLLLLIVLLHMTN